MNVWKMLGIEPTTDIARIKSAYARQAKLYHPEEYPEEFKALQKSYKIAIQMAKSQKAREAGAPEIAGEESQEQAKSIETEGKVKAEKAEVSETAKEAGTKDYTFDFSEVDSYGDQERFFKQFLLICQNPYLINNLNAWEYLLKQNAFMRLFESTDFRKNFVRTMCGQFGWRRKTILYFKKYLNGFHREENKPADGKWETELTCFRIRQIPVLRWPAIIADRYMGKEGRAFHKRLCSTISSSMGREIDLDMRGDLINYLKLYLSYGESREVYIGRLKREWGEWKAVLAAVSLVAGVYVILMGAHSLQPETVSNQDQSYVLELYDLDADSCTEKEQEDLYSEYKLHWGYAEEAIDDVLRRYEYW